MRTAGLLLAAGGGRRMGGPKALLEFDGQRLVERGVALLRAGGCDPVHVVLGAAYETVAAVVEPLSVVVVRNPAWESGMGSSLRTGLESLPTDVDAVVVALVDQPLVGAEAVRRLLRTGADGAVAAVATYEGKPRNPALLGRSVWSEVASLAVDDVGARAWLRAHPELVEHVPCDDTGSPLDLDTPSDSSQAGAMEQRTHFVTVATADLEAARRFYVDGLGWTTKLDVPDEVLFFQVGPGLILGFFEATKFAADVGLAPGTPVDPRGLTLSHNVASRDEVDRVLSRVVAAGGTVTKPAQESEFGGIYHGQAMDPNGTLWEIAHNPGWRIDETGEVHFGD